MNLDLVPAPAFEKSLVPAYQTNFTRIRNAFLRVGNRISVDSFEMVGGWPKTYAVAHPFKADILVDMKASCWATAPGMCGLVVTLDGTTQGHWAQYYFNETGTHKLVATQLVMRGISKGVHSWGVAGVPGAAGAVGSDGNDWCTMGLTFIEVN